MASDGLVWVVHSNMAEGLAQSLQSLSSRGITVIASMHCPSSTIAQHFSSVLLLTPDGRTAYHGPYQQVHRRRLLMSHGIFRGNPVGLPVSLPVWP